MVCHGPCGFQRAGRVETSEEGLASTEVAAEALSQAQLTPILEQALEQWEAAGWAAGQLAALRQVQVTIADLPGTLLGLATAGHRPSCPFGLQPTTSLD